MNANKGCDTVNYKGIMDGINSLIKRSGDLSYVKGLEDAKTIVKDNRVNDINSLESRVKRYAFNNEVNLDEAAKIVIMDIFTNNPSYDWYGKLFGC